MRFDVITLFPEMVSAPFRHSLMARAIEAGRFTLNVHDLRRYALDRHRVCDDYPFGGGEGMVLKVEPIARALEDIVTPEGNRSVLLTSPGGRRLDQALARTLAKLDQLVIVCGHYEGVDDRVRAHLVDGEISIGDYVLSGGELAACVIVDVVARLLPGVVGDPASVANESFETGLLDHPQYTRPRVFAGMRVPDVLLSGDHARIARWRRREALRRTWRDRKDLLETVDLSEEDRRFLEQLDAEQASSSDTDGATDGPAVDPKGASRQTRR